jgi:hypothetical protein
MKDTRTLRTFLDDCALTLRYAGGTAHFELWVPGEATPEPLATLPAAGGAISWAPSGRDLLEHYDGGKEEMVPVAYAEDIRSIVEDFAALPGDRRGYTWNKKWCVWEVSDADEEEEEEEEPREPIVQAYSDELLKYLALRRVKAGLLVTWRDDRDAGPVGWRIRWDGDEHRATSDSDAPEVYYLVEVCSEQYGKNRYGTQVWRIENGKVTHEKWFEKCWTALDGLKRMSEWYSLDINIADMRSYFEASDRYHYLFF